jgi:flagellin-specific chaperone FliS
MSEIYTTTRYDIEQLLSFIEAGSIWLPDLQRPFVWKDVQVRKLLDSLYHGYPVGFFLFWKVKSGTETHTIGSASQASIPDKVIIDGQQRLTSLFAVIKGKPVIDINYKEKYIKLAFNPKTEVIEVYTPAMSGIEWIPDISELWKNGTYKIIKDYESKNELTEEEREKVANNIQRLYDVKKVSFSALEILDSVEIDEVSEIFVRINSEWKKLNQLDFILTLLSVYWEEGRKEIEDFAYNKNDENKFTHLLEIVPGDIIKILVSFTFYKGRLRDMYNLLKWRDTTTREFKEELRLERLQKLQEKLKLVLNQTNWNDFFQILVSLGFKNSKVISSSNNILYSYNLYLIGKYDFGMEYHELRKYIGKYYAYLILSAKYNVSVETTLEKELSDIQWLETKESFIEFIDNTIRDTLGEDFWNTTIVNNLKSSSSRNNIYLVYLAGKIRNNTKVFLSDITIWDFLDDKYTDVKKNFLDVHHIFPKNYLHKVYDLSRVSEVNQVANYVYLHYNDNIKISDLEPREYYRKMSEVYGEDKIQTGLKENDIPSNFYELSYDEFLDQRRKLMVSFIREYFNSL